MVSKLNQFWIIVLLCGFIFFYYYYFPCMSLQEIDLCNRDNSDDFFGQLVELYFQKLM